MQSSHINHGRIESAVIHLNAGTSIICADMAARSSMPILSYMQSAPQGVPDQNYRAAAASVLGPAQLAVFNDALDYQRDQEAMVNRAMAAAKQQLGDFNSFSWGFP